MNAATKTFRSNIKYFVTLLLCCMAFQSCTTRSINLTDKPRFHGGYSIDALYELKKPLLYNGQSRVADHFYWPGISSGHRVAYEKYIQSKESYPGISIVPKGTRFRFIKMEFISETWAGNSEWLTGKFVNGPLPGLEFDLSDISTIYPDEQSKPRRTEQIKGYDVTLYWPDLEFVKVVEQ